VTRADLVHALALLQRGESIAILLDADRARDDMADRVMATDDTRMGIVCAVATAYRVEPTAMIGRSRAPAVCAARHTLAVLLSDMLGMSTVQIGRYLGGRDHSTVVAGMKRGREDDGASAVRARELAVDVLMRDLRPM